MFPSKKWYEKFEQYWVPGEKSALKKIDQYLIENINQYKVNRDRPDIDQTSRISPHLKFGEISPRVIVEKIKKMKTNMTSRMARNMNNFCFKIIILCRRFKNSAY